MLVSCHIRTCFIFPYPYQSILFEQLRISNAHYIQPKNTNKYPITTRFKYMQDLDSSMGKISQVDCKVWNCEALHGNCTACYQVTSTWYVSLVEINNLMDWQLMLKTWSLWAFLFCLLFKVVNNICKHNLWDGVIYSPCPSFFINLIIVASSSVLLIKQLFSGNFCKFVLLKILWNSLLPCNFLIDIAFYPKF